MNKTFFLLVVILWTNCFSAWGQPLPERHQVVNVDSYGVGVELDYSTDQSFLETLNRIRDAIDKVRDHIYSLDGYNIQVTRSDRNALANPKKHREVWLNRVEKFFTQSWINRGHFAQEYEDFPPYGQSELEGRARDRFCQPIELKIKFTADHALIALVDTKKSRHLYMVRVDSPNRDLLLCIDQPFGQLRTPLSASYAKLEDVGLDNENRQGLFNALLHLGDNGQQVFDQFVQSTMEPIRFYPLADAVATALKNGGRVNFADFNFMIRKKNKPLIKSWDVASRQQVAARYDNPVVRQGEVAVLSYAPFHFQRLINRLVDAGPIALNGPQMQDDAEGNQSNQGQGGSSSSSSRDAADDSSSRSSSDYSLSRQPSPGGASSDGDKSPEDNSQGSSGASHRLVSHHRSLPERDDIQVADKTLLRLLRRTVYFMHKKSFDQQTGPQTSLYQILECLNFWYEQSIPSSDEEDWDASDFSDDESDEIIQDSTDEPGANQKINLMQSYYAYQDMVQTKLDELFQSLRLNPDELTATWQKFDHILFQSEAELSDILDEIPVYDRNFASSRQLGRAFIQEFDAVLKRDGYTYEYKGEHAYNGSVGHIVLLLLKSPIERAIFQQDAKGLLQASARFILRKIKPKVDADAYRAMQLILKTWEEPRSLSDLNTDYRRAIEDELGDYFFQQRRGVKGLKDFQVALSDIQADLEKFVLGSLINDDDCGQSQAKIAGLIRKELKINQVSADSSSSSSSQANMNEDHLAQLLRFILIQPVQDILKQGPFF